MRHLWQKKWDTDNKGRHYYNKSITLKTFIGKRRQEEVVLARLRLGHMSWMDGIWMEFGRNFRKE